MSLSRSADVAAALRHPQASTDDRASRLHQDLAAGGRFAPAYLSQLDDRSFLHRDPPDHTRLRKLAARAFTPHRAENLRPFIQRQAGQAIDAVTPDGRLELVEELAWPLPIEVICELIGIPAEDRPYVASAVDEHPVSALGSRGAYPALGVTVRTGRPRRGVSDLVI